ncbi:MAG: mercuric reductase [Anaerolineales bacterium]
MSTTHYDVAIIGSGQGAPPLAYALAEAGKRVAVIEREHVGGTCVNEGCTPTKLMIAGGRVAYLARRSADYGVLTGPVAIDMEHVRQRKRDIVERFRSEARQRLEDASGIDVLMGEGRFVGREGDEGDDGPFRLEAALLEGGARSLTADLVVINTGASPRVPDLPGLEDVPYLNSTSIMELSQVPEHLIVLGGGYIGIEFGQLFRRLGSEVTMVQRASQLLTREDEDIADAVAEILREDGIQILLDTDAVAVEQTAGNRISLRVRDGEGERAVCGSHLLIAVGRVPNSAALNLDAVGVATSAQGHILVNDRLETNVPGIYAIGDVKGGPAFTHIAYDDFRILRTNLLEDGEAAITGRMAPYTLFMDPQLGRVGLNERAAQAQGIAYRVAKMPMSSVARAIEMAETRGLMKALVDPDEGRILGVAILGVEGGELMSMLQIAMLGGVPYPVLRDAIFAHPTLAESFNNLFATLD